MKKTFAFLSLATLLAGPVAAQDAIDSAARTEELKRLNASIEELITTQAAQTKRLQELSLELDRLRAEVDKAAANDKSDKFVTKDELRKLADSVKELDQQRLDDRKLILEEIRKLAKVPVSAPPRAPKNDSTPSGPPPGSFEYVIQPGDTISGIVTGVNKQHGLKVTVDQVLKVNPKVDPKKLQVGQKIYIPGN